MLGATLSQPVLRGGADLAYIRREIPIEVVAQFLGLDVKGHFARCFRSDSHADGDREPSLHFFERKNRAICFGCGNRRAFSNLDLVMGVLQCNLPAAVAWFRGHFQGIPALRGRPAGVLHERPFRVGVGGLLEPLVRSGVYATLSNPARSILTVIRELAGDQSEVELSYTTLQRKTGIGSRSTVKSALDELTGIRIVSIRKGRAGILQPTNIYVLTPDNPDLARLMNDIYGKNREEIARDVAYRREVRLARRRVERKP